MEHNWEVARARGDRDASDSVAGGVCFDGNLAVQYPELEDQSPSEGAILRLLNAF